jgi:predicted flap endonuclease-1-like 5' DNA nuclease
MRSDYALYVVALIFFAITAISLMFLTDLYMNLSVVATAVLGLLFVGVGYTQRPKAKVEPINAPPPPPPSMPKTAKVAGQQKVVIKVEPAPVAAKVELIAVKGIKEKRAEQLKALGIRNVEDLANASAEDLAKKLNISPWFTEKWINSAKELLAKS